MRGLGWWHVLFATMIVVLSVLTVFAWAPNESLRWVAWATLAVMIVAYVTLGIPALKERPGFALPFGIILIACAGVLVFFSPNLAIVQAIVFPLLWSTIDSTARSIAANVALGVVIAISFIAGLGTSVDSVTQAVTIEALSLLGSIALGLWITRIATLSHERQRLIEQLGAAQNQLAALNRDSGIASERERLAREIHDTIAQDLTGLVMLTQRARRELGSGDPSATLELLEESARAALAETRALVASGAPVGIAGGDITDALGRLAERFSRETGVTVGVETGMLVPLDRDAEVVLLRVAQESLANVRKHSGAESAVIELDMSDGVRLTVRDDGTGFEASTATSGFGLSGMRERLALVGGSLEVASSPTGTTLIARLPK